MASTSPELFETALSDLESSDAAVEIDEQTAARAEAEQRNEMIVLNDAADKWKLDVGTAFHCQWQEIKDKLTAAADEDTDRDSFDCESSSSADLVSLIEDTVFVISFLGDTSSGKSFVARYLLTGSHDNDMTEGPVIIDETKKTDATTANVNCYVSSSIANSKTLILDYEGEKGSQLPLLLYARRGLTNLIRPSKKAETRRQAVSDYFPKLAYILSDVVILLGNDDLSSADYLARCHGFASKANDGVSQMVHRPLLIIIQNKAPSVQLAESSAVTQKFFEIHGQEADALRPFFSDIKCFCLPYTDSLQRTKTGILDSREIFDHQMTDLKRLLATVRGENSARSFTHAQWLCMLQRVLTIVQSGKSVSIHTLLSEIIAHDDDKIMEIVTCCFLYLYNGASIHSPIWFADCYLFTIRVLAHCLAVKAYRQRELMSERIINEWCEKALQQLSIELDQFRPCEALYTGKGRSSKQGDNVHPVYCYQHKGAHEGGHRTCQLVYGLTLWKQIGGWPSTDVWPGEFVSSNSKENRNENFLENMIVELPKMVRELMTFFLQDPEAIYHRFVHLFYYWCDKRPVKIICHICFCASSSSIFLRDSNDKQSKLSVRQKRRRQRDLLAMQYRFMTIHHHLDDGFDLGECQTCYQKLYNAWDRPQNVTSSSTTPT